MRPRSGSIPALLGSVLGLALLASACAASTAGSSGQTPGPSPSPLSTPALKLAVLGAVGGKLEYCDPDAYPLARGSQLDAAKARLPTIQADRAAYLAILAHEGLREGQTFTDQQLIAINDDYKQMQAIRLGTTDEGFTFDVLAPSAGSPTGSQRIRGVVSRFGQVRITDRGPGSRVNCPICLAAGVLIATPAGPVPVQGIEPGMAVWTVNADGRPMIGRVIRVGSSVAPIGHEMVRLRLADGRSVVASPGHPTADGRTVGDLRAGDRYDGSVVASATLEPYGGTATYDLLPSGPTGDYVAGGILLGSTLRSVASTTARVG